MANPVILVVDDEPAVLRAVERELRGHFGAEYTVLAAGSGEAALDVVRRLALRETPLALLLVDQRMPRMTGIEFLAASLELAPLDDGSEIPCGALIVATGVRRGPGRPSRWTRSSSSSAPSPAPTGWPASWSATGRASS